MNQAIQVNYMIQAIQVNQMISEPNDLSDPSIWEGVIACLLACLEEL